MELLAMLLCSALAMVQATTAPETTTNMVEDITETMSPGDVPQWSGWIYRAFSEGMMQFYVSSADPKCSRDGLLYRNNLQNLTLWATRMFDASALSPSGFVSGDTHQFGHFDECVGIEVPAHQITGKYCMASVQYGPDPRVQSEYYSPPAPLFTRPQPEASVWDRLKVSGDPRVVRRDVLHMAVCVPSSCSAQDVQTSLLASLTGPLQEQGLVANISLSQDDCYSVWEQPPFNSGYYIVMFILYFMAFLAVVATLLEYNTREEKHPNYYINKYIKVFSTYTNMRKLLKTNPEADFKLVHFLKFFGIYCVILGHKGMYSLGRPIQNIDFVESFYSYVTSMLFLNGGGYIVDTFFMFSGFLTCHFLHRELKKRQSINIFAVIIGKILRIMPIYVFMIAFHATVLPYLGSGPIWNSLVWREALRCQKNWWTNVLFLNNYINVEDTCMIQGWYLACDMHFFIIGITLIYIRFKHPKLGNTLMAGACIVSVLIPSYITYVNNYKGVVQLYHDLQADPVKVEHFRSMYVPSHVRFIPYMVGVLMSYLCQYLAKINFKIPGALLFFIIPAGIAVNLSTTFIAYVFYIEERPFSLLENVLYAGVHRVVWALTLTTLMVIDYTTGIGKWGSILRHRVWAPLGRLSYCAFLVHTVPLLYTTGQLRSSAYYTRMTVTMTLTGEVINCFTFALILNLFFESPLQRLQKMVIKRLMDGPKKSGLTQQNIVQVVESQLNLTCGISKISITDETNSKSSISDLNGSKYTLREEY